MNNNRQERQKTFILFVLMFVAINYGLYTFVVAPNSERLDDAKTAFIRQGESQSILESLILDKEDIESEIIGLKAYERTFYELVVDDLDTVNIAYDFYEFCNELNITGISANFDLDYIEERLQRDEAAAVNDDNDEEGVIITDIDMSDELIIEVPISVEMTFPTLMSDIVVDKIRHMTDQRILIEYLSLVTTDQDLGAEFEESSVAYTVLKIGLLANLSLEDSDIDEMTRLYEFFETQTSFTELSQLFATEYVSNGLETDENNRLIEEGDNDEEIDEEGN